MIAYVSGKLVEKRPTDVVVDVQGLGYHVLIPTSTYEVLPSTGEAASLLTYLHVREDALVLFGFASADERQLFEALLGVSGIGPKLALAALSAMRPSDLRESIVAGEPGMLTNIPGVGRRTAERMIVELKDRLAPLPLAGREEGVSAAESTRRSEARADALAALEQLGYARAVAERNLRKVLRDHPTISTADELVRLALREH